MSIDDIRVPSAVGVDVWRSVLHDVIDEVLDQILLTVEYELEDERFDDDGEEPPGDPPDPAGIPDLSAALRDGLAAEIGRGLVVWGCDGTLRCTRAFTERVLDSADPVEAAYRRRGVHCDCAVLRTVLGRASPVPRCANRARDGGEPDAEPCRPPGDGSWPWW